MNSCVLPCRVARVVVFLLLLAGVCTDVAAQNDNTGTRRQQRDGGETQQQPATPRDTLQRPPDETTIVRDTVRGSSGPVDTAITYYARDSVSYSLRERKLRLVGDARVTYHDQQLEAAIIEIYFDSSLMIATSMRDSTGRIVGVPKFTDKGESFYGERLTYNFRTRQGTITLGETVADDGFYFGEKIKRVDENTLFIEEGCFTTCDHPHPHYYFKSPTMKVVANDRIYVDPLVMYVEDLPVFAYPFGLFLENKRGRRSGLIIPRFFFSGAVGGFNRGIVFENLGYYWATSDYFDTRVLADITTKGGFTLYNISQFVLRDELRTDLTLAYGKTRFSPEEEFATNWNIEARHDHTISPYTRINGTVRFSSQDFNRRTQTDLRDRIQQSIFSNASFQHTFDNGSFFSVTYSRDQNIITNQLTEVLPTVNYSIPNLFPLRSLVDDDDSWLSQIAFSYSATGTRVLRRPADNDTINERDVSTRISHTPTLSIAPKIGYLTITPQISYSGNVYFRRQRLTPNLLDSSIERTFENGLFYENRYDLSLRLQLSPLYGIVEPGIGGINAVRHTFIPSVSFTYTPDFSSASYGYYDSYIDPISSREVRYPIFGADGGGGAAGLRQQLDFSFANNFDAKIASDIDTIPDRTVQLLNFNVNSGYNFAADSLKWQPITVNARTSAGGVLSLAGNASFDLYDQARVVNVLASGDSTVSYQRVNTLLASTGRGLARLTNASFSLQTAFSSQGVSSSIPDTPPPGLPDSLDYGSRFTQRLDTTYVQDDVFGDNSPGFSSFSVPWNISLFFNFSYSAINPERISRAAAVGASFGFDLTRSWRISSSFNYDFISRQITIPTVEITKDLHCWEFRMSWYPTGLSRGFSLRLNVKSALLQDLKVEKTENALYN